MFSFESHEQLPAFRNVHEILEGIEKSPVKKCHEKNKVAVEN